MEQKPLMANIFKLHEYQAFGLMNQVSLGHLQLESSVQLFDIAFAIKRFSFCGTRFKRILAWKRDISKM